jgi:hypothetical protein
LTPVPKQVTIPIPVTRTLCGTSSSEALWFVQK